MLISVLYAYFKTTNMDTESKKSQNSSRTSTHAPEKGEKFVCASRENNTLHNVATGKKKWRDLIGSNYKSTS